MRFLAGWSRGPWLCVAALLFATSLWAQDLVAVPPLVPIKQISPDMATGLEEKAKEFREGGSEIYS